MNEALLTRIKTATHEMSEAEGQLSRVLKEMDIGGTRAEKTTVTAVVEMALEKLRAARATVAELERLLGSPD